MDIFRIRQKRLRLLIDTFYGGITKRCAEALDLPPPQLHRWLSITTNNPRRIEEISARNIEKKLGLERGWLDQLDDTTQADQPPTEAHERKPYPEGTLTGLGETRDIRRRIPLISWVQAGSWNEAVDIYEPGYAERWLPHLKTNGEHTYALRVEGDSMTAPYGKSYPHGCIIFVDPLRLTPVSGERIIAKLQGSSLVTFKVFIEDTGRRWLKPLNPQHPPIMEPFQVLGTVVGKWEDE